MTWREMIETVLLEDAIKEILPRFEYGYSAEGGCDSLDEVREGVSLAIELLEDTHPDQVGVFGTEEIEGMSHLLWADVQGIREEAEVGVKDCDEIEETNRAIHQKLCREGNSGGVHFV